MALSIGIVGMPNSGKSALFQAMSGGEVLVSVTPYATVEPEAATVPVPDPRVEVLSEMFHSKKTTHAAVEFIDTVGIASGASAGQGMGTRFLSSLRDADALLEIVRFFDAPDVGHVEGKIDPDTDAEILTIELCAADAKTCEKVAERLEREAKKMPASAAKLVTVRKAMEALNEAVPVRTLELTAEEREHLFDLFLLTAKPLLLVANVGEGEGLEDRLIGGEPALAVCAAVEADIARMAPEERQEFLEMEGLAEPAVARVIRAGFHLLGLETFLTAGEPEARSWTIRKGSTAPVAAGAIHSDIQRGFIKAEVVAYDDLISAGSMAAARAAGKVRQEGKTYVVVDGDVIEFKFNV
jgi:GTP-binding protein YchF